MSRRDRGGVSVEPVTADPLSAAHRALLRLLNRPPWSGRIARWAVLSTESAGSIDAVIAIPARDESERIETCLEACSHSAELSGLRVRLLILVNGTRDDTADRALAWAVRRRRPITLIDVDFVASLAHAGAARRLALELAGLDAAPHTMLLTTDADARPGQKWVVANVARLYVGASLVCGRVVRDPVEVGWLPAPVRAVDEIEGRYRAATVELQHLLDPNCWNPWPHHGSESGASLAIRAADLVAVGGVPLVPRGEGRALARGVRVKGLPVVHADEVEIEVPCRFLDRTANRSADTPREQTNDSDPLCDEALEPAAALCDRLVSRARLRLVWASRDGHDDGDRDNRRTALLEVGARTIPATILAGVDEFERVWDWIEHEVYEPKRHRLRITDLIQELPVLLTLLDTVRSRPRSAEPERRDGDRLGMVGTGVRAGSLPI